LCNCLLQYSDFVRWNACSSTNCVESGRGERLGGGWEGGLL
jgi:hypothetical protein